MHRNTWIGLILVLSFLGIATCFIITEVHTNTERTKICQAAGYDYYVPTEFTTEGHCEKSPADQPWKEKVKHDG